MAVVSLTEADNGQSVQVRQGDAIIVRLPENPTTGYRWHIDRASGLAEEMSRHTTGSDQPVPTRGGSDREAFGSFDSGRGIRARADWS